MKLGSGGFGTVYKGTLDNGVEVAIKKTNCTVDTKGISEQVMNEVTLLSQVNHRNLVRLHGCCLEVEVPMLVYEYLPNGDLYQHLQRERPGEKLSWKKRLQIAIDTAEALRYLHSAVVRPIYQRDVKTSNILLDNEFNVKVAELLTSLKPVDLQREEIGLKAMALPFIQNKNVKAIVDAELLDESAYDSIDILVEMQSVGELPTKCPADNRHGRPSMKEVVAELVAFRGFGNRAGHESDMSTMITRGGVTAETTPFPEKGIRP